MSTHPVNPGSAVIPAIRYRDAHAAVGWLERAFGFRKRAIYDGPEGTIAHGEMTFGTGGMIMLGSVANKGPNAAYMVEPEEVGGRSTGGICLIVPDAMALYTTAKAAGAKIVMELAEMDYGGKAFTCSDPEGHLWSIGEYDPWAVAPVELPGTSAAAGER